jgi:hypothetical protein
MNVRSCVADRGLSFDPTMNILRSHPAKITRRHFLLCDAHAERRFWRDGKLLLDFHTFPLRIEELPDKPRQAQLRVGYTRAGTQRLVALRVEMGPRQ